MHAYGYLHLSRADMGTCAQWVIQTEPVLQESERLHLAHRKVEPGRAAQVAHLEALAEPDQATAVTGQASEDKAASETGSSQDAVLVNWDDVAKKTGGSSADQTGRDSNGKAHHTLRRRL